VPERGIANNIKNNQSARNCQGKQNNRDDMVWGKLIRRERQAPDAFIAICTGIT
jgi:hypothetical protein